MPANAWQVHAEIDCAVGKVDECSRAFTKCWEQAKVVASVKDKEKHATKLNKLISSLRQHKTQLRKWTAQNALPSSSADKLKGAQAKIDRDLRRYQEFETALKKQSMQAPGHDDTAHVQESMKPVKSEAGDGATESEVSSSSEVKVQWDQLLRDGTEDGEMIEEFICKICQVHVVGNNPKLSKCSHLYCGDCIRQWFDVYPRSLSWAQRAQAAGSAPCPVCKEPLKEETDLFPVCAAGRTESAFLYRVLSGLKIQCSNHARCRDDGRCDWTGEYGSFQEHVRTCKNVPLGKPAVLQESKSSAHNPTAQAVPSSRFTSEEGSTAAPDSDAWDTEDAPHSEEPATPPAEDESADSSVVVEAPDAEAADQSAEPAEPEPAEPTAAAAEPASLTDLIKALVDLKVQSYTQKDVHQALAEEPVQEQTVSEPTVPEPAAQASVERVAIAVPYAASGPSQLTIAKGDLVDILERNTSGWTFGRRVICGSEGWFPEWAIHTV